MSKINAIVINPSDRTVLAVEYEGGDIRQMYALIGCHTFDAVAGQLRGITGALYPVTMWVDDEGALKAPEDQHCSLIRDGRGGIHHLAGNILVTGPADEEGETLGIAPALTEEVVRKAVVWNAPPVVPGPWTVTVLG
jgi:hypothetical protein